MNAWVYMLRCSDGSYYVGSARDPLEHRIAQHQSGEYPDYTSARRPVVLVWSQDFDRITDTVVFERQLKGWSRQKKEALIRGNYNQLPMLAARRTDFRKVRSSPFETRPSGAPQDEEE